MEENITPTEMKAAKLMWIKGLKNKMISEEKFEIKTADLESILMKMD